MWFPNVGPCLRIAVGRVINEQLEEVELQHWSAFPRVWHFTLRFVLPGAGLATPVNLELRAVAYWTQSLPYCILLLLLLLLLLLITLELAVCFP